MKKPWPWEVDEKNYIKQYKETIINIVGGMVIVFPLLNYFLICLDIVEYITDPVLFPSLLEIFKNVILRMIAFDTLFYWIHRFAHTPWFYNKFHKQHHEYKVSVAIATYYNHPLDFIITNIIPNLLTEIMFVKIHVVCVYMWVLFVTPFVLLSHCGYNLSWSPYSIIPFVADTRYHDYHHSPNIGNYGIFFVFWDTLCKTNKWYVKYIQNEEKNK